MHKQSISGSYVPIRQNQNGVFMEICKMRIIFIGLLSILVSIDSNAAQKSFTNYSKFLSINNSTFNFAKLENYNRIASLGFLQNTSEEALKNIVIEVQYYNSSKK